MAYRVKKSEKYYQQHEADIHALLTRFRSLNQQLPFTIGFSDRHHRHIGMDIRTDTLRYALNNEFGMDNYLRRIAGFGYDTLAILDLQRRMYETQCIRIGATDIFYRGTGDDVVILSFRSVVFGNPFLDRKYYNLIAFEPGYIDATTDSLVRKQGYRHVKDEIYFKIMGTFR